MYSFNIIQFCMAAEQKPSAAPELISDVKSNIVKFIATDDPQQAGAAIRKFRELNNSNNEYVKNNFATIIKIFQEQFGISAVSAALYIGTPLASEVIQQNISQAKMADLDLAVKMFTASENKQFEEIITQLAPLVALESDDFTICGVTYEKGFTKGFSSFNSNEVAPSTSHIDGLAIASVSDSYFGKEISFSCMPKNIFPDSPSSTELPVVLRRAKTANGVVVHPMMFANSYRDKLINISSQPIENIIVRGTKNLFYGIATLKNKQSKFFIIDLTKGKVKAFYL